MASEWTEVLVGDVFDLIPGFAFKSADFKPSGIPALKIKNVKANEINLNDLSYVDESFVISKPDKLAQFSDILITMSGNRFGSSTDTWVGKVAQFRRVGPYLVNQRVGILRLKKGVQADPRYCACVLSSPAYQEFFVQVGTSSGGQANLSPTQILTAKFVLPALAEQDRIARLLGGLDDRRASLLETSCTLESVARSIFKSWFVDFDPVRAKAEGREPEGMDAATATLFPSSIEDSTLGPTPTGWTIGKVSDLGRVVCGKTPPTSNAHYYAEQIPFVTIPDMHGRVFVVRTGKMLSQLGAASQHAKTIPALAICVSCIATVGLVALTTEASQTNQQINSIIPNDEFRAYFSFFAMRDLGEQIRSAGSGGSVFGNLNKSRFESLAVLLPPPAIAEAYSIFVAPFFEKILSNVKMSNTLAELRDTLLPRLISGKLRVPEAEKLVEGAL